MSSGAYDGSHASSLYPHGDSWRPSGSTAANYDRSNFYPARRRSPSPSRRYASYEGYYPPENNYRPNSYRPDEDEAYYSRSPSPDHFSRIYGPPPAPDTWERPTPWAGVPPNWDDTVVGPVSPTSSTSKARRDGMHATRLFEPSNAWKQNHVDRPSRTDPTRPQSSDRYIGEPLAPQTPNPYATPSAFGTPNSYGPPNAYPVADRYRTMQSHREPQGFVSRVSDSYRPGWSPSWSPNSPEGRPGRAPRKASGRFNAPSQQISGTGSKISSSSPRRSPSYQQGRTENRSRSRSRPSSSRGRRSYSRSSSRSMNRDRRSSSRRSRSRRRRSISRGRRSLSRGRRSVNLGNSSASPGKRAPPVKYSWDRPSNVSVSSITKTGAAVPPLQKGTWTRSASRSSIASTRASEKAPSPSPPQTQTVLPNESSTTTAITSVDSKRDNGQEDSSTHIVTASTPEVVMSDVKDVSQDSTVKVVRSQAPPSPHTSPTDAFPCRPLCCPKVLRYRYNLRQRETALRNQQSRTVVQGLIGRNLNIGLKTPSKSPRKPHPFHHARKML
ncbi:hypothetical protein FPV67DRAFT_1095931 [Lyophyllum atratum]|nr:hypothetical protein FPV67DRAFT_1095931 [Lyophyllum atratum]